VCLQVLVQRQVQYGFFMTLMTLSSVLRLENCCVRKDMTTIDKDDNDVALNEEKCNHTHILVENHTHILVEKQA